MARDLTGFEMVVASANNGAVQNVTDEIPAADAIDEAWRDAAAALDYFPEIATGLLAPEPDTAKEASASRGWGLVAARLGNKGNRSRFVTTFWYHRPDDPDDEDAWWGLLEVLKDYERTGPDRPWSAAVADFRAVEARVEALRGERSEVYRAVGRRAELDGELATRQRAVSTAMHQVEAARARQDAARATEQEQAAVAERIAMARQAEAEQGRPSAQSDRAAGPPGTPERGATHRRRTQGHRRAGGEVLGGRGHPPLAGQCRPPAVVARAVGTTAHPGRREPAVVTQGGVAGRRGQRRAT